MNRFRYHLKFAAFHWPLSLVDAMDNFLRATASPRILITRHSAKRAYTFHHFLAWVTNEVPELRSRLEFHRLPCRVPDWSRYAAHASWSGDTLELWSPRGFRRSCEISKECQRRGIRVINRVEQLECTGKSRCAALLAAAGIRAPRCAAITDAALFRQDCAGLRFPLLIREERGHGRPAIFIPDRAALDGVDFAQFSQPIAAEYIDTRHPQDGLFRKYRYIVAGDAGVARHMIVNDHWEVRPERRLVSETLRKEELAYLHSPDPHHDILQRARIALGLDIVGFDYSLDHCGRMVVWEANPFLNLNYPKQAASRHIFSAVERSFAAVARWYLVQAGVVVPNKLVDILGDAVTYARRHPGDRSLCGCAA